jgi:hypothetical protein
MKKVILEKRLLESSLLLFVVIVFASTLVFRVGEKTAVKAETNEYSMTFDSDSNHPSSSVGSNAFDAKTDLGGIITMAYSAFTTSEESWGVLGSGGYLSNVSKIGGLKKIHLVFQTAGSLSISYGWFDGYPVSDVTLSTDTDGGSVDYLFGGEGPSEFLLKYMSSPAAIKSIRLTYSCVATANPYDYGTKGLTLKKNDAQTGYVVTGYTGSKDEIVINSSYAGLPIVGIADQAFKDCSFDSISLPNSLKTIGESAFYGCTFLSTITIPDSVTTVGASAFDGCTQLLTAVLSSSMTSIPSYCFENCTSLNAPTIPESIKAINEGAFKGSSVYKITLPSSVISLGTSAFENSGLSEIVLDSSLQTIGDRAFYSCSSLKRIVIPLSVTTIGYAAFSSGVLAFFCEASTKSTLWDSSWYLGTHSVVWGVSSVSSLSDGCTYGVASNTYAFLMQVPAVATTVAMASDYNGFPVRTIAGCSCFGCSNLKTITVSNKLTEIDSYAFYGCSALTSVDIPDTVSSIGEYAFEGCKKLASFVIPASVTALAKGLFQGCSSLNGIILPNSVISLGNSVFKQCVALQEISIPSSVTIIPDSSFSLCSSLKTVSLSSSLEEISASAFYSCSLLTSIILPDSLLRIQNSAFYSCSALEAIFIPASVTYVAGCAFQSCAKLTISCAAASKPTNWETNWNTSSCPVIWGATRS